MGMFLRRGPAPHRTRLYDKAEGSIIKIAESGTPVAFYIAKHNYEAGLNGDGRTLMVRKDCYDNVIFNNIDSWISGTYLHLLEPEIQTAIGTTKFYYVAKGSSDNNPTMHQSAVFMLSLKELGKRRSDASTEGTKLPIAELLQIAYLHGKAVTQWTRTPVIDGGYMICTVKADGTASYNAAGTKAGCRPVFTLPSDMILTDEMLA